MSKEIEEWKPVVGYEGLYEVSDWGNVRSLDRSFVNSIGRKRFYKGQMLKKVLNADRYHIVSLRDSNHNGHEGKVHRLVAEAFIPNPENKPVVGHLKTLNNGLEDKTANEAWNIAWMTEKENLNYGTIGERLSECKKGGNNPMKRPEVAAKVAEKQRENGKKRFMENPEAFFERMNRNRKAAY